VVFAVLLPALWPAQAAEPHALDAKACEAEGSAEACARAGDYLWHHNGTKNLARCAEPGEELCVRPVETRVSAIRRIDRAAYKYHDKACAGEHAEACNRAGVYHAVQFGGAGDEDTAAREAREAELRFAKACKLGSEEGCRNVGSTRPLKR
jgi:TPR repeat protein